MNDEEHIQELYRLYWKYMIDKDVNGLHEIQSEDYFLCHMTGVKQTRAEFEKGLLNGTFNYYSADHDSIEVMIDGDTARMIGCSTVIAEVYGGVKREDIFLSTKLWPSEYENPNAVDETLERLGVDYVDLLYIHHPAGNWLAGYRQMDHRLYYCA